MPHRKTLNPEDLTVGDRALINLHHGRMEAATIKAITPIAVGAKYQVDFGSDETCNYWGVANHRKALMENGLTAFR